MSIGDEIEKLSSLKKSGDISEEEFQEAKKKLLSQNQSSISSGSGLNENQWGLFIHLAPLIGPLGWVLAVVLWQVKKNESDFLNQTGKNVTNWLITSFILYIVFTPFAFIYIGLPFLFALWVAGIAFAIIGGIKANEGIIWPYPMTFNFIK